jgi:dipeptidyl aminopeptidase/acylaminoacyl peptidase
LPGGGLTSVSGHDLHDPIDGRILVVASTGGAPVNIAPDFQGKFEHIAWTAANEIQFVASRGVESIFGRIRPDGSRLEPLAGERGLAMGGFARSRDGQVALVASTPSHPNELYVLAAGQRQPQRVTDSNPWLADVALGEQRVVRYTARDGAFEIEGLLILPVGYQDGTRVPLIVTVHGGPEAHYLNGWLTGYNLPGQLAAGRGYAVFYPNYRGSTGQGLEFVMSSQGDAGGREFDDIVDGVDHLIALGIADGERVGVTGGSYGGYATAWMSTYYSDRFAAGVMNVGVSNNISKGAPATSRKSCTWSTRGSGCGTGTGRSTWSGARSTTWTGRRRRSSSCTVPRTRGCTRGSPWSCTGTWWSASRSCRRA